MPPPLVAVRGPMHVAIKARICPRLAPYVCTGLGRAGVRVQSAPYRSVLNLRGPIPLNHKCAGCMTRGAERWAAAALQSSSTGAEAENNYTVLQLQLGLTCSQSRQAEPPPAPGHPPAQPRTAPAPPSPLFHSRFLPRRGWHSPSLRAFSFQDGLHKAGGC